MERISASPGARRFAIIVGILLMTLALGTVFGCSQSGSESSDAPGSGPTDAEAVRADSERYPELEGLVFVRQGSIWAVEDGIARQVIESESPWSLRDARSGDAITYASLAGTDARIYTAARGDWRTESMWETDLGSLLVQSSHDDIADTLWFSVSGEQTATIGVRDGTGNASTLELPVEASPHFAIRYEDGTIFVVGASQEPARLYEIGAETRELHAAATLFSPRLSPDGARVLVTGSEQGTGAFHLWVVDTSTGSLADLGVGTGVPTDPVWSRDGTRVAFRDTTTGTVWIVPAAEGGVARDTGLLADEGGLAW